jgi:methionyl-tRNA formyltransferase
MRIIYFGSSSFGVPSLEAIRQSGHSLVAAFTQPARPAGRHRHQPRPTEVALWCREKNVPYIEAGDINTPECIEQIKRYKADLLVVIAFGQKVAKPVIDLFPKGAINTHGSLLPKYRGAAPINWAIINGESETGASIITLADRMDAGLILSQVRTLILPEDNFQSLHDRLAELSAQLLVQTIDSIENNTAVYQPQDESLVTKAPKLKKEHGFIDWLRPAADITNQIRGLWPWPGAVAVFVSSKTGKSWKTIIAKARPLDINDPQGHVCGALDNQLNIICGRGHLKIDELKPAGSDLMDFRSFVNGRQGRPGDLFLPMDMVVREFA